MDIAKNNDDNNETDGDKSYVGEADDEKDPRSRKKMIMIMIMIMIMMMMMMIMMASPWLETSTWWRAGTERHCH